MAVITQRAGAKETVRQKREREQELLVWPDLVFVEFICAVALHGRASCFSPSCSTRRC